MSKTEKLAPVARSLVAFTI